MYQELLDGSTKGPRTTTGPIGKAQIELENFQGPFVRFTPIPHNLPPIDRQMLIGHADLLPLHDFIVGVGNGNPLPYLETKRPVPMHQARFV